MMRIHRRLHLTQELQRKSGDWLRTVGKEGGIQGSQCRAIGAFAGLDGLQ